MIEYNQKSTTFWGIFALSFVAFCFFLVQAGNTPTFFQLLFLFLLLSIQITMVTFVAILPSSPYSILLPISLTFLGGAAIFDEPLAFFLFLGLPFSLLFFHIQHTLKNRIKVRFSDDIRRSFFLFFLLFSLFASFLLSSRAFDLLHYSLQQVSQKIEEMQENIEMQIGNSLEKILSEEHSSQMKSALLQCEGFEICERKVKDRFDALRENLQTEQPKLALENPLNIDRKKLEEVIRDNDTIQALQKKGIAIEMILGMLLFLLSLPLVFIASFFTTLFSGILYSILSLLGVFRVTHQEVKKEVIV